MGACLQPIICNPKIEVQTINDTFRENSGSQQAMGMVLGVLDILKKSKVHADMFQIGFLAMNVSISISNLPSSPS
jgi:hypothetical protein